MCTEVPIRFFIKYNKIRIIVTLFVTGKVVFMSFVCNYRHLSWLGATVYAVLRR